MKFIKPSFYQGLPSPLLFSYPLLSLLQRIYKGKDTRGFLFCKPKMHEVVASALQNSLSDFKEIPVSESKQAFAFANYHN
jgi:hypothetical protein